MDKKKIPLNAYLISILIFLTVLYGFSFVRKPSKDNRKLIKTVLVIPKYAEDINQIQINSAADSIVLQKNNDIWEISDFENPIVKIPADSEKINRLISQLTTVTGVYKVSSKNNPADNFGFDQNQIKISLSIGGEEISELCFGKNDFTQTKRYVKSGRSEEVLEMKDTAAGFLTTSIQNWSESTIISQQILGKIKPEDIQRIVVNNKAVSNPDSAYISKLLELRHGGINSNTVISGNDCYTLKLELGNKDKITLEVWETNTEGTYLVCSVYEDESRNLKQSYFCNISSWTFSKLKYE